MNRAELRRRCDRPYLSSSDVPRDCTNRGSHDFVKLIRQPTDGLALKEGRSVPSVISGRQAFDEASSGLARAGFADASFLCADGQFFCCKSVRPSERLNVPI